MHNSPIKRRGRAIEKLFRSYSGDGGWVIDLVRAGITFTSLDSLMACVERIRADPEVGMLQVPYAQTASRAPFLAQASEVQAKADHRSYPIAWPFLALLGLSWPRSQALITCCAVGYL